MTNTGEMLLDRMRLNLGLNYDAVKNLCMALRLPSHNNPVVYNFSSSEVLQLIRLLQTFWLPQVLWLLPPLSFPHSSL